ncbi:restriction endonuclease subunit S [Pseudomonas psychrophila]|uniref:restriction endonuclease subunit S n=1 Tax=Pseudomonas psychrophila TaxID=122355 RepID=UPI0037F7E317
MAVKPGYKQTEVGVIPEDWEVCPVLQKGEVVTGKALAVNAPGALRPYLRTKNVFDGRIDIDDVLTMPMTDEQFAQFRIRNGDVLLNEGQSLELIGRCAIYQDEYPEPCAIQNALLRFRARAGVSDKFASYLFRHCQQTGVFARIALQTTSVAHLGGSRFERLCLAWPTEAEQLAIATALSDVDALLSALERLIAKKCDLKKAAMQQLLTGQTRLPGFQGEWEKKTLGLVLNKGRLGGNYANQDVEAELPLMKMGNLARGYFDLSKVQFITPGVTPEVKHRLVFGDVLFNTRNTLDLVGKVAIWRDELPVAYYNSNLMRLEFDPEQVCSNQYANYALNADSAISDLRGLATGTTSVAAIYTRDLMRLQVIFPPLPEQTAIAAVLTDIDVELAALKQRLAKTRALKQGMMQELLTGRTRLL